MSQDYIRFLKTVPFFSHLENEYLDELARYCREESFAPGEILFREGDAADRFFIMMKGQVEVWKSYGTQDADLLTVHGPGKPFGEMALVDAMPRYATLKARSSVTTLVIHEEEFLRLIRDNSAVALAVIRSLSAMVRRSNDTLLEDLKQRNLKLEQALKELQEAQDQLIQQERLSNLGKFSSMILHDIRNPISIVQGYAEILKRSEELPQKHREYVENIMSESERLAGLANEFLDYSRGEIRLDFSPVELGPFLEKLEALVRKRVGSKKVRLKFEHQGVTTAIFDHARIFRVLVNLTENARKALGREGELSVRFDEYQDSLRIVVRDTGEGMSPEVLAHVFEPFYSSSKQGGTGLGMLIVKNIVEAHHGDIDITSSPGKGTEITILLPLRKI
ncbi:histidine kinase [Marispirochaeta aestuarii]|uniref:histidine kinase n=1 Tax=Marispirochaeta aestuarii TaxID=1963862 RepID=A0A1Y1S3D3_9SPIO|nr:ATP-binding protein [Marispirochaeta aestuarii]ORC37740.1 histidine kinase [Marispirochaeta aestuarii]